MCSAMIENTVRIIKYTFKKVKYKNGRIIVTFRQCIVFKEIVKTVLYEQNSLSLKVQNQSNISVTCF